MSEVQVSVICTAYNQEKYIKSTLEGFVMQKTNFPFEVIVHDDASTDTTADIIREYEQKYPDIIKPIYETENQYSKKDGSLSRILRKNIRGKYVAFCEGDDFWIEPYKLQKQYDALENNPDCVACFTKVLCCNEDGSHSDMAYPKDEFQIKGGLIPQRQFAEIIYAKGYVFQTNGYFFRKEVVENKYKFEYAHYLNGDETLLRSALILGNVYYIDEPCSYYRICSAGSWNEGRRKYTGTTLAEFSENIYHGNLLFDKETNYVYHDLVIKYATINYCRNIAQLGDRNLIFQQLKKFDLSMLDLLKSIPSVKAKIQIVFSCYFPASFKIYRKVLKRDRGE